MEKRFDLDGNEFEGVFFTESSRTGTRVIEHVRVEISRQNSNLFEVKHLLADKVKDNSCNTLINFRYGQRKHSTWESILLFKWDSESWYGEGDAVKL